LTSHRERAAIRLAKGYKRRKLLQDEHPSSYMPGVRRVVMNTGGAPGDPPQLDPLGMYSRGAVAAQQLPQARGTPQQMASMLQRQGVKQAELAHTGFEQAFAGRPAVTREELAQHFAQNAPQLEEKIYGGEDSIGAPRRIGGGAYVVDTPNGQHKIYAQNDEDSESGVTHAIYSPKGYAVGQGYETLDAALEEVRRWAGGAQYGGDDQTLPGGENYRELVLKTPEVEGAPAYTSSHWDDANVLAHVRMADRVVQPDPKAIVNISHRIAASVGVSSPDALGSGAVTQAVMKGAITPEEAASYSRARRFMTTPWADQKGLETRLLHVEEIQSDWGQQGRQKGFRGEQEAELARLVAARDGLDTADPLHEQTRAAMQARINAIGAGDVGVPSGPFVRTTEGWTDLALKRILLEAANGGYDGVVFTPGEHQFERSGNEGLYKYYDQIVPKRLKALLKDLGHDHEPLEHAAGNAVLPGFRMTPELRERVKRGLPHFRDGGGVNSDDKYVDPTSDLIGEWQWRDLPAVRKDLKGLSEIPSHVKAFGSFMDETANRAGTQGLSARDLIKAYTITRASIQRQAVDHDRLRASGLVLPGDVAGKVRPEGAFGHWLHTNMGQKYLREAERGQVAQDAVADAVRVMAPFGKHEKDIPDALIWAAQNLPGREAEVSRLVAAAQQDESAPQDWRAFTRDVRGIGPSKSGFVSSLMGRGDQPTLDARQIILHTGRPTKEASKYIARRGGKGGEDAVNRLAARQSALDLGGAEGLKPYYQHLAHHAVWDAAGDEVTTHEDVMQAMRGAATGGRIENPPAAPALASHPVAQGLAAAGAPGIPQAGAQPAPQAAPQALAAQEPGQRAPSYGSWRDVPSIDPQALVGKRVFPIFADLTKAGGAFEGIDASRLDEPEPMFGGPGYPLLPESQQHGLGWAVEGKGRGSAKIRKDADYVIVSAMDSNTHQSNASFANALMKNMAAYVRDKRLSPDNLARIDDMIRAPSEQAELQALQEFPGFAHGKAFDFIRSLSFEGRKRIAQVLESKAAQELGAPNLDKVTRATLDQEFAGTPSRHAMFVLEIPKGSEDEQLVHLQSAGLPEHPSYQYGIRGRVVGKFHTPVAPEILFKDWFDKANAEAAQKAAAGQRTNVRRAFDLAMPVVTVSQEVADMLPRHPRHIQSGKAAQMALAAFNDQWHDTHTPVNKGGLGPAEFSQALKNSDYASTLSQYSIPEIREMAKTGQFSGFKLKGGEVYFGLKRGTNYADEYGFSHPDLSDNETALVSVVNNEPGAKGIGGAPVVLKAIQHGATALDCYAVPSQQHPSGFLPRFYEQFGFEELGRVPFDPQYVSAQQLEDMKHVWTKDGWDPNMGFPPLVIMKWRGSDDDRAGAVRRFVEEGRQRDRARNNFSDVGSAAGAPEQGAGPDDAASQGRGGQGDDGGDRGGLRADRRPRPADRFTRTLAEIKQLSPPELAHYGIDPADVELARSRGLARGGRAKRTTEGSVYAPGKGRKRHPATAIPGLHISSEEHGEPVFTGRRGYALGGAEDEERPGITAWHGSGADFDEFDMSKVGSGMQAQAYGHGLYFSENPDTAREYRDTLVKDVPQSQWRVGDTPVGDFYQQAMQRADAAPGEAMAGEYDKLGLMEDLLHVGDVHGVRQTAPDRYRPETMDWFEQQVAPAFSRPGKLYEVHIDAHPEHFLDWDKPIMQQPHLMRAIEEHLGDPEIALQRMVADPQKAQGAHFFYAISGGAPSSPQASKKLASMGVHGVTYQDDRWGTSDPVRNYVVFDDKRVKIRNKYKGGGEVGHKIHSAIPGAALPRATFKKKSGGAAGEAQKRSPPPVVERALMVISGHRRRP
jgi:hypothetical protein